jgi:hypothetical protein
MITIIKIIATITCDFCILTNFLYRNNCLHFRVPGQCFRDTRILPYTNRSGRMYKNVPLHYLKKPMGSMIRTTAQMKSLIYTSLSWKAQTATMRTLSIQANPGTQTIFVFVRNKSRYGTNFATSVSKFTSQFYDVIIIIIINCKWVFTRLQWYNNKTTDK